MKRTNYAERRSRRQRYTAYKENKTDWACQINVTCNVKCSVELNDENP